MAGDQPIEVAVTWPLVHVDADAAHLTPHTSDVAVDARTLL